jgi:hypothetical protein
MSRRYRRSASGTGKPLDTFYSRTFEEQVINGQRVIARQREVVITPEKQYAKDQNLLTGRETVRRLRPRDLTRPYDGLPPRQVRQQTSAFEEEETSPEQVKPLHQQIPQTRPQDCEYEHQSCPGDTSGIWKCARRGRQWTCGAWNR